MRYLRLCRIAIAVSLGVWGLGFAAEVDPGLATELVQYVRTAKQAGAKDAQIRQDAITAGWPSSVVDQTIAYVNQSSSTTAKSAPRGTTVKPAGRAIVAPTAPTSLAAPSNARPSEQRPASSGGALTASVSPQQSIPTESQAAPPPSDAKSRGVPDDYVIGAGDVLEISVWKEPDASVPSVVVRPDGKIAMPLIKEVTVAGLTPLQVEKNITDKLSSMINGVDVTVIVTKIDSKKIYVLGAVKKEGTIAYTYQMSVIQALSEAGGLNDYAKRKKIYVLRHEGGKDYRLPFDYEAVIKGEKMEQNIQLLAGDTIVVPQ